MLHVHFFDKQMPEVWEDVKVTIRRDKIPDENGPCANHLPRDDDKSTRFVTCRKLEQESICLKKFHTVREI